MTRSERCEGRFRTRIEGPADHVAWVNAEHGARLGVKQYDANTRTASTVRIIERKVETCMRHHRRIGDTRAQHHECLRYRQAFVGCEPGAWPEGGQARPAIGKCILTLRSPPHRERMAMIESGDVHVTASLVTTPPPASFKAGAKSAPRSRLGR